MKHTFTNELYVQAQKDYLGNISVVMNVCDMSQYGYVHIDKVQVTTDYDVPDDFNFTQAEIDCLVKQKQKIQADTNVAIMRIDEQIQSLRCLEYKPEVV
jgi:hypothetical protein